MKVRRFVLVDNKTGAVLSFEEASKGNRQFCICGTENETTRAPDRKGSLKPLEFNHLR